MANKAKAERGLEISTLAIVDVDYKTAYHVFNPTNLACSLCRQTKPALMSMFVTLGGWALPKQVRYVVTGSTTQEPLITEAILEQGLHQIGKLRHDANLRYLYQECKSQNGTASSMMANSSWVKRHAFKLCGSSKRALIFILRWSIVFI
ncbi:MAG: hypothetical protein IPI79_12560 [Moraxellaceae bacterium]|nr:hypothetical protein [Moraxellaceae bacterium]